MMSTSPTMGDRIAMTADAMDAVRAEKNTTAKKNAKPMDAWPQPSMTRISSKGCVGMSCVHRPRGCTQFTRTFCVANGRPTMIIMTKKTALMVMWNVMKKPYMPCATRVHIGMVSAGCRGRTATYDAGSRAIIFIIANSDSPKSLPSCTFTCAVH